MVPTAVLMRSGIVSLTTTRPVNIVQPKRTVNSTRPMTIGVNTVKDKNVNTARPKAVVNTAKPKAVLNVVKGNQVNVVKASACWVWKPKTKVLDHVSKHNSASMKFKRFDYIDAQGRSNGCSRHMTGNMSYLTDFEEIDGGYVAFGGNPKGGKITGRVPRNNNMYSVDLKNIVPKVGLTCVFAKATSDESKLWHRRLGHINFITMNKLVKGNLVRGLPSKLIENDQTCVACQKGKQHRASCKSKTVSSISQPLHMLHMDLFGLTFVKSLMKKIYCLVVTDDYSRFSWVFFLATKDETSSILKSFIIRVENLIDQKVKVIRCDNGTEFKNKEMNQFCKRKCIKREFSVARTPQQNRVAERKNRTLIEDARIMLANSKLPTTFWAEAVSTACYVQNRVLVTKPHNKTPYELFLGRNPALGFIRPFGCLVTILNTIDNLGKFDGKADEGFFVGYSINSKARMETVPDKYYILLPLWPADLPFYQNSTSYPDAGFKPSGDNEKKVTEEPRKEGGDSSNDQEKEDNVNDTNNVNDASTNEVNVVCAKTSIELPDDLNMPELEVIVYSDDDEDVGVEADMNNFNTFMHVIPILTTRIHKDHPVEQIIRDLNSAPQTRRMTKNLEEHGLFSLVQQRTNHKDFQNCLFACFLSQEEPKKMDVKSSFLYGKIEEEVYVCQPPGTLWTASSSKSLYVTEILKKFGFTDVKIASTPMETQKPLLKDEDGKEVDVYLYRSIIGSLMYLTSSRPDVMFALCACARYQVNPKVSHFHVVKRIFRYLKGQPKLGLYYPKNSPFDLVAYTDSDYAGASLYRKSTTGGCQFLGCRLISWQCKKQTIVSISTTEAEYVVA
ncbi:putative ribonuclease H-like domain-containing protein [Tanacetum coccineum]